jgi:NADPH:quinone reductase-like Zn-dependent oxidoreductase
MKAIVYSEYGTPEVLKLKNVEKPGPKDDELLIKIHATAVNSGDWRLRKAEPFAVRLFFGLFKPKRQILGAVLAGEVSETGKNVSKFKTGDRIFGMTGMTMGGYAEYKNMPEGGCIAVIPAKMSYEEAASVPFGATTALHFLRKAGLKEGQKVLIYGASGSVGTAAVQIAKHLGAEVTGVCSTRNVSMVKSLGADKVIDYTKENISESSEKYDLIFETVGKITIKTCKKMVKKNGKMILSAAGIGQMLKILLNNITSRVKIISGVAAEKAEYMIFIKELIEKGEFKPVIDRVFLPEEIRQAHGYVEKEHKRGNVIVTM